MTICKSFNNKLFKKEGLLEGIFKSKVFQEIKYRRPRVCSKFKLLSSLITKLITEMQFKKYVDIDNICTK